jgi:hypothetical protein
MIATKTSKKMKKSQDTLENCLNKDDVSKILGTVTYDKAFYFYENLAKPTGEFAVSLSDFCNKINAVNAGSLVFHLKRGDFQKWIREVIGDVELANRINKIKVKDNALRDTLHAFVSSRINELKETWPVLLALH